ncbi:MAG TPA: MFS transporter [Thermomicrobiaceae bacterium]|nr:MFS transporter [Thermomicrobiaceae bacterium]
MTIAESAQEPTVTPKGNHVQRAPLLALLIAMTISQTGSALTMIALPWFVLQTSGSAALTGLAGFFVALPGFLAGVFGGTLIDRLGFRRSSIVADTVSGLAIASIPALYFTIGLPVPLLLGLIFIGSLLEIPGVTGRRSMLPELAASAGVRLERVNAAFESTASLALLLGPPLAGLLIIWLDTAGVLWLDAASFIICALLVGLFVPYARAGATVAVAGERYRDALLNGIRFLLHEPLLRAMAIGLALSNATMAPLFAVVLPVYAQRDLGSATDLGLMATAVGAGSLAGALGFGVLAPRIPRPFVWFSGYLLAPLVYWVLLTRPGTPMLLGVLLLMGLAMGPINPLMVTIRHERIPAELRGRVFATYSAISQLVTPLGIVLAGFAIAGWGLHPAALALAVTAESVAVAMFFAPSLRHLPPAPQTAATT